MDLNQLNGIIRAVVPAVLAYLVGKGWLPGGSVADITAAALSVAAAVWSVKTNAPAAVIQSVADHPEVEQIVVTDPSLAAAIPSPKVVAKNGR